MSKDTIASTLNDLRARLATLEAENAKLKAGAVKVPDTIRLAVGDKGGICAYGLTAKGFPTTLYLSQLVRYLDKEQVIRTLEFARANYQKLSQKSGSEIPVSKLDEMIAGFKK